MKLQSITVKSFSAKLTSLFLIAGLLFASTMASVSKNTKPNLVEEWYVALKSADAAKFESLMSDDAGVELKFLDVTQSKSEFIGALDEWKNANKDAQITTRIVSSEGEKTIVEICYRFPSNEVFGRESFTVKAEKIVYSLQEEISQTCPF